MRFIIALLLITGGILAVSKSYFVARFFGSMEWAEKMFGVTGTITAWKLIGVGASLAGIWLLFNDVPL
jgi:hypothetical protein